MTQHTIKIRDLSFSFEKKGPYFFKDLSTEFSLNKLHFIRGKNGSGKSTLFRIIRGNVHPHERIKGCIKIAGEPISFSGPDYKHILNSQVKMVEQKFDSMIADQFTFVENLQLAKLPEFPTLASLPAHQQIPKLIKRFGIDLSTPTYLLSGGQRQILAILMSLQKKTSILLLDEPTAALDDKNAEMVMSFIDSILVPLNLTVLVICHDRELAETYAGSSYHELTVDEDSGLRALDIVTLSSVKLKGRER